MQDQGTKLLYARLLCFMAEVSQQFRANASSPRPRRKIFNAGAAGGQYWDSKGRQKDTGSICLDMSRYEPGQTICYPVRISQSYIYRLAGAPVRLKYAQISLQKIVKQRQLPVLCQKKLQL